jgi:regulatory protein
MNPDLILLKSQALKYLSFRSRSESEVRKYLLTKSHDSNLVTQVLEYLKQNHLLNDAEFSRWVVESRSRTRPKSKFALSMELKQKGIPPELISQAVNSVDDLSTACALLERKKLSLDRLGKKEKYLKARRLLSYRGYSLSVIEQALAKLYNDSDVNY